MLLNFFHTQHLTITRQEVPYDHPRIYLAVNPETKEVTCPYCSKKFILE